MTTTDYRQDDLTQPPRRFPMILSLGCSRVWHFLSCCRCICCRRSSPDSLFTNWCMCLRASAEYFGFITKRGQLVAVGIVAFGVVLLLTIAGAGIVAFVQADNLSTLFNTMTDSIERWRSVLPDSIAEQLPVDVEELRQAVVAWLGLHAGELKQVGTEAGRTLAHIFRLGIGVLASLHDVQPHEPSDRSQGPCDSAWSAWAKRSDASYSPKRASRPSTLS